MDTEKWTMVGPKNRASPAEDTKNISTKVRNEKRRLSHVTLQKEIPPNENLLTVWENLKAKKTEGMEKSYSIGDLTRQGRWTEVVSFYRTKQCILKACRYGKICHFWHEPNLRRRSPAEYSYSTQLCKDATNCWRGDDCKYAHNIEEINYHPLMYKTRSCKNGTLCLYRNCSFSHGVRPRDGKKYPIVPINGLSRKESLKIHFDDKTEDDRLKQSEINKLRATFRSYQINSMTLGKSMDDSNNSMEMFSMNSNMHQSFQYLDSNLPNFAGGDRLRSQPSLPLQTLNSSLPNFDPTRRVNEQCYHAGYEPVSEARSSRDFSEFTDLNGNTVFQDKDYQTSTRSYNEMKSFDLYFDTAPKAVIVFPKNDTDSNDIPAFNDVLESKSNK